MEISNEELFEHAMSDEQPEVTAETQVTEGQDDTAPRDDQGRFVEKTEEARNPSKQAKPESEGRRPRSRLGDFGKSGKSVTSFAGNWRQLSVRPHRPKSLQTRYVRKAGRVRSAERSGGSGPDQRKG
jgi:hypothetical protein